ncbi:MAG: nitrilase-related carbon-nitrogen hydrolase [Caldilineaceae bacterium]
METYRAMGLQGVEMVVLGYNTPAISPDSPEIPNLQLFHNHLSMQAGAYQNGCWAAAAAKAGWEEGVEHIGGSCIIAPTGQIVAQVTPPVDELISLMIRSRQTFYADQLILPPTVALLSITD